MYPLLTFSSSSNSGVQGEPCSALGDKGHLPYFPKAAGPVTGRTLAMSPGERPVCWRLSGHEADCWGLWRLVSPVQRVSSELGRECVGAMHSC